MLKLCSAAYVALHDLLQASTPRNAGDICPAGSGREAHHASWSNHNLAPLVLRPCKGTRVTEGLNSYLLCKDQR